MSDPGAGAAERAGDGLASHALELFRRAADHARHGRGPAVRDGEGGHGYDDLLGASLRLAGRLLEAAPSGSGLDGARVAFLVPPGARYVAVQWGTWLAGGVAVPLCLSHPRPELEYVLDDAEAGVAVAAPGTLADRLRPLAEARGSRFLTTARPRPGERLDPPALPEVEPDDRAMILYTSGTTGRPKGVVHTHASLAAQVRSLVEAWGWRTGDRILHVLPLHHTHGIVNALLCPLWAGAECEIAPEFDPGRCWERFASGEVSVFMAVPTIYYRLLRTWESASREDRDRWSAGARRLRLMVSGSAALPVSTFEKWNEVTGHNLLERYGMTEIGMALSNPLEGERRPGTVGRPLPGVGVRLVDDSGRPLVDGSDRERGLEGGPGEIEVRGATVFREYWRRSGATREAFRDGWFRTGDEAVVEQGYYRILGRKSVDILKSGGEKISALEIEEVLRRHPGVDDCAVVGVPDPEWGERVCAAIVPAGCGEEADRRDGTAPGEPDLEEIRAWTKARLAPYKAPREIRVLSELPRNAMGKVVKPEVVELFEEGE